MENNAKYKHEYFQKVLHLSIEAQLIRQDLRVVLRRYADLSVPKFGKRMYLYRAMMGLPTMRSTKSIKATAAFLKRKGLLAPEVQIGVGMLVNRMRRCIRMIRDGRKQGIFCDDSALVRCIHKNIWGFDIGLEKEESLGART